MVSDEPKENPVVSLVEYKREWSEVSPENFHEFLVRWVV